MLVEYFFLRIKPTVSKSSIEEEYRKMLYAEKLCGSDVSWVRHWNSISFAYFIVLRYWKCQKNSKQFCIPWTDEAYTSGLPLCSSKIWSRIVTPRVFSKKQLTFFFITKSQMNKRHDYYVRKLMMSIIDSKGGRWSRKEVYTKRGKSIMLVGVKKGRVIIELHYEINQVIVEKIVNQLFHHNIVKYHHNCVV